MATQVEHRIEGTGTETFRGKPAFALLLLLCIAAGIYIGNAAYPGLLDDADASHATVSREMLERGDGVILYMNGIRYLMKAPLHYWAVALSYGLFGANAFSTRLPVALSMAGLALLVYGFARRYFGERAGLYSGLVVCTGAGFFLFTRIMIPEAIYALEFTAIFYLFLRGWTGTLEPRLAYWGTAALTALAMLTRGLIGVIFPAAIIGLFIVLTQGWNRWRELRLFSGTLIFLAIAAPWHILASLRASTFFWSYFINEHFRRAVGARFPPDYEAVPLWLWLGAHLIWFFPWSVFLPGLLSSFPHPRNWKTLSPPQQARLLLVIWMAFILLFFSMTFGSRMEYYSFGAWPAIAILLGSGLAQAEEAGKRWVARMQAVLAVLGAAIAGVLGVMLWIVAAAVRAGSSNLPIRIWSGLVAAAQAARRGRHGDYGDFDGCLLSCGEYRLGHVWTVPFDARAGAKSGLATPARGRHRDLWRIRRVLERSLLHASTLADLEWAEKQSRARLVLSRRTTGFPDRRGFSQIVGREPARVSLCAGRSACRGTKTTAGNRGIPAGGKRRKSALLESATSASVFTMKQQTFGGCAPSG